MQQPSSSQPADSSLPGVPDQRMLALTNTYIVHTTKLLNNFAASCEHRLQQIQTRLRDLDTKVQILEAKVDSAAASREGNQPALRGLDDGELRDGRSVLGNEEVAPTVEVPDSTSPSQDGNSGTIEDIEEICLEQVDGDASGSARNSGSKPSDHGQPARRTALFSHRGQDEGGTTGQCRQARIESQARGQ